MSSDQYDDGFENSSKRMLARNMWKDLGADTQRASTMFWKSAAIAAWLVILYERVSALYSH